MVLNFLGGWPPKVDPDVRAEALGCEMPNEARCVDHFPILLPKCSVRPTVSHRFVLLLYTPSYLQDLHRRFVLGSTFECLLLKCAWTREFPRARSQ